MKSKNPVLLVHDDDISVDVLRTAVENAGYEVVEARNGLQALDITRARSCRLIVSD